MKHVVFSLLLAAAAIGARAQSYLPLTGGTLTGNLTLNGSTLQLQTPYIGFNNGVAQPSTASNVAIFPNNTSVALDIVGWSNGWHFVPVSGSSYPSAVATIDPNGTITSKYLVKIASNQFGQQLKFTDNSGSSSWWWMGIGDVNGTYFSIGDGATNSNRLVISGGTGYVGIGTIYPQSLLAVAGTITAKKVVVTQTGWSDYVFDRDYKLRSLRETEKYILANKHLPDVPSAADIAKDGVDLSSTQADLLRKIEELTLYAIEQDKQDRKLKQQLEEQNKILQQQQLVLEKLENELNALKKNTK